MEYDYYQKMRYQNLAKNASTVVLILLYISFYI